MIAVSSHLRSKIPQFETNNAKSRFFKHQKLQTKTARIPFFDCAPKCFQEKFGPAAAEALWRIRGAASFGYRDTAAQEKCVVRRERVLKLSKGIRVSLLLTMVDSRLSAGCSPSLLNLTVCICFKVGVIRDRTADVNFFMCFISG